MNNRTTNIGLLLKLSLAFFLLFGLLLKVGAQVKIGDNPTVTSPSAVLEVESATKGFLKPRLTTAQRTAIASPASGLEVYDTDTKSTWYYNGTVWVESAGRNIYNTDGTLTGNRVVGQGANRLSFTGTVTNAFSVDGTTFSVDAANNAVGFGTISPNANAVVDATAVNKGILLPRVALSSTNSASPLSAFVAGMTVYNTATAGTGATAVTPGLYYSDGSKWILTGKDYAEDPVLGTIAVFPVNALPNGYLECNGAAVSRTTYAALFAKIGTTYGAGDGSTTFNLPDLRGEFIRGWDNGRGVDAGRVLGSSQVDATSLPNTAFTISSVGDHTHSIDPPNTTTSSAGAHTHSLSRRSNSDENSYDTGNGRAGESSASTTDRGFVGSFSTSSAGAHTHTIDVAAFTSAAGGSHTHTLGGGDAETRPRNVAMVYAIKAVESILVPASSSPGIAAAAATNEPWYKVGTSTGATANTDNVYINGNVGIGTTTPQARLFVTQAPGATTNLLTAEISNCGTPCAQGTARNIVLSNSNGTNGATFASLDFVPGTVSTSPSGASIIGIDRDVTNNYAGLQFWTRNATDYAARITIKSSGNVGIGTTAPTSTLTVGNAAGTVPGVILVNPENAAAEGGQIVLAKDLTYGSTNYALDQYGGDGTATNPARFRIHNTGGDRFVIMDNGNVGMGTINPASKLDVNGNITTNASLVVNSSDGNNGGFIRTSGEATTANGLVIENTRGAGKIIFSTNSGGTVTEKMRITFDGKVGIGTPSPTQTLTVGNAAGTNPGLVWINPSNTAAEGGELTLAKDLTYGTYNWTIDQYGGTGTATNLPRFRIFAPGAPFESFVINENGNVGMGGTTNPSTPLQVNGAVRVGNSTQTAAAAGAGAIRYNSGSVEYSNGSAWLPINTGTSAWSSPVAMGLSTTGGALTTGTVSKNEARYRRTTDDTEVSWEFSCDAGGTGTTGSYLFTLPAGVTFNLTRYPAYTALTTPSASPTVAQLLAMGVSMIPAQGSFIHSQTGISNTSFYILPYNATQFRILGTFTSGTPLFMSTNDWNITTGSKPFLTARFNTGNP